MSQRRLEEEAPPSHPTPLADETPSPRYPIEMCVACPARRDGSRETPPPPPTTTTSTHDASPCPVTDWRWMDVLPDPMTVVESGPYGVQMRGSPSPPASRGGMIAARDAATPPARPNTTRSVSPGTTVRSPCRYAPHPPMPPPTAVASPPPAPQMWSAMWETPSGTTTYCAVPVKGRMYTSQDGQIGSR